jgi:ClpP class serine protease
LKEVLYAADRQFLERYLQEKSAASPDDMREISALWSNPIPQPGTAEAVNQIYSLDGAAARIRIEGPLSIEGPDAWDMFWGYGGASYTTIRAAMERAKTDPPVEKVIFDIDSPGGTVSGVDETWQAHKALAAVKPTEVRAQNMLASAAYYLAVPAGKILASSPTTEAGSIGVLVAVYDWSKWEENTGIKEVVITSGNAPDKHPDVSTKHGRDAIKARLDALERIFYARVSEGRGVSAEHIAEKFGKGGLLVAWDPDGGQNDAVKSGMIDGLIDSAYDNTADTPPLTIGTTPHSGETIAPAPAGTKQEGQTMDLSELLKANPAAAAAEVDRLKAEAKAEGRAEAQAEYSARVEKILPVLTSEAYPSHIKALAEDAFSGGEGMAAFKAGVSVYDAQAEKAKSDAAKAQTGELGVVGAEAPGLRAGGEKELDAALQAELDKRRAK